MGTLALARYQGWDRVLTTYLPVIVQASVQFAGRSR